jgi:predicted ATPase
MALSAGERRPYVFVSYASADRDKALQIAERLEARGIVVWLDRKSIAGGTSWTGEIVEGIKGCAALLVLISASALASPNVQQELQLAWEHRRPLVPLRLDLSPLPSTIEYVLAGRQWIDVLDLPEERWLAEALRALQGLNVGPLSTVPAAGSTPPSAAQTSPPPEAAPARHNLPVEVTSFVGRERELAEVRGLLATTHLLTLTGTGGCGKTRLALKLGESVVDDFADGVWLVELAPLSDPVLIPHFVATAVGVREIAGRDLTGVLLDALRPRRELIILDNCEHLIADCAQLAESLLRGCPHLRIVATSREILGASGETVWRIPSLPVPDPRQLPSAPTDRAETVASADAVRLFVERAHQAVFGFQVTPDNAMALAQICFRLDGIPLAIELAASRLRTISVEQIAARLDSRFRLLTGGSRTSLRRQQTLQALIDWSYDLLAKEEQAFFRKLSVFVGGWQLEAAEAVCAGEDGTGDVLDLLAALADKSLVAVETTSGKPPRYRLLETLREYALERLVASGEAEAIHTAHAAYYVALAEQLEADLNTSEDYLHTGFVEEIDNMRAALRWYADAEDWNGCLGLIGSLCRYWFRTGYLGESGQWLDFGLHHQTDVTLAKRGQVLVGLGQLAWGRGDYETAETVLRESIRVCQINADHFWAVRAHIGLGNVLREAGRLVDAAPVLEGARRLAQESGNQQVQATVLRQLGLLAWQQSDLHRAQELLAEGLRLTRGLGSVPGWEGTILYNLGLVAEDQDDLPGARVFYSQSVPLLRESGFRWHLPVVLEGFASLAARQAQAERALVLAGAAASARDVIGSPIPPAMKPRLDQAIARARQDLGEAAAGAWSRGQAMTLEQAIDYALSEEPFSPSG